MQGAESSYNLKRSLGEGACHAISIANTNSQIVPDYCPVFDEAELALV